MSASCSLSPYHGTSSRICAECGLVPDWLRVYFDHAGVPVWEGLAASATSLFAVVHFEALLRAFERAGLETKTALGAAYALGGPQAARDFVRGLGLPGVKVDRYGVIVWDISFASDIRHEGAA